MSKLRVRITTHPFQGKLGTLGKSGKHISLDDSNVILLAKWFKFYPATV